MRRRLQSLGASVSGRKAWLLLLVVGLIAGLGAVGWHFHDSVRSNQFLYDKAQAATPERASALYALLATRLPELQEYCLLWSAQARLPKSEAVADLHDVIHYRPDGAAAYAAHLALARYYATIESPRPSQSTELL